MTVEALPRTAKDDARNGEARPDPVHRRPIAIDLFAGAGGLSVGLEQAGFDVAASVEYDPIHAAVHAYNFPLTAVLCEDISALELPRLQAAIRRGVEAHGQMEAWDGRVDLVAGGPPCQGFSTIGKRLVDDKRNRLVFEFFRLVSELRPRYFLMENVPGMLAGGHKSAILDRLTEEFRTLGYSVVEPPRVLRAANFGVPQDRRRLVLLGAAEGQVPPRYPSPTVQPRSKKGHVDERAVLCLALDGLPDGPSVWDAIGDLPDADDYEALIATDEVQLPASQLASMTRAASSYALRLRGLEEDSEDFSHPRVWDASLLTSSMRTAHTGLSVKRFSQTAPGETEPVSRFYRLTRDGLCNTIRAGTGSEHGAYTSPRPIHPTLPRVLTVREAARLHSFPDWFRLHRTKWHGFRQVGNAVPPLMARAVGHQIIQALGVKPVHPLVSVPLGAAELLRMDMSKASEHFEADASRIPGQRMRLTSSSR